MTMTFESFDKRSLHGEGPYNQQTFSRGGLGWVVGTRPLLTPLGCYAYTTTIPSILGKPSHGSGAFLNSNLQVVTWPKLCIGIVVNHRVLKWSSKPRFKFKHTFLERTKIYSEIIELVTSIKDVTKGLIFFIKYYAPTMKYSNHFFQIYVIDY